MCCKNIYALEHQLYHYYDNFKLILLNSKTNSCGTVNAFENNVNSKIHLARQIICLRDWKIVSAKAILVAF